MKINFRGSLLGMLVLIGCIASCSKKDTTAPITPGGNNKDTAADILSYSINNSYAGISFTPGYPQIIAQFPDTATGITNYVANFTLSPGATLAVNGVAQVSGVTPNSYYTNLNYSVTAADGVTKKTWVVIGTNNLNGYTWGLGNFITKWVNNDTRHYNWYIDQGTTGVDASVNCGPSSTAMAIKWSDSTSTVTAATARAQEPASDPNGSWFSPQISGYLIKNNVPYTDIQNLPDSFDVTRQIFETELDKGHVIIVCLNDALLSREQNSLQRIDKYYLDVFVGHCIVIDGYVHAGGNYFFQVCDPWDWGAAYPDGTLKGKNRFYHAADVVSAVATWNNEAWSVAQK